MILYMCGEDQVGLYSIGARFLALLNVVVNAINTAYTTFAFKNKDSQNAKEMYSNVFTLISFLLLGICFTIAMFSRQFVELMADQKYHSAYTLVGPLMFSQAMMAFSNLVAYGISFMEEIEVFLIFYFDRRCFKYNFKLFFSKRNASLWRCYSYNVSSRRIILYYVYCSSKIISMRI